MKKTKLFSAFFAAAALASCSSDDLNVAGNSVQLKNDGTQLLVTVGDGDAMRSGYAQGVNPATGLLNSQFVWTKGDRIKVYCEDTWKPQAYECVADYSMAEGVNDGAIFENKSIEDLKKDNAIRQYGIYPYNEDDMKVEFSDDERSSLRVNIPTEMRYKTDDYTYGATVIPGVLDGDKAQISDRVYYKSLVPLFGYVNNDENKLNFQYMTAVLRVNLTGVEGDKAHTLKLSSTANKLSGVFEAQGLEIYNPSMDITKDDYPRIETEEATNSSISVSFLPVDTLKDYTIYIPVPMGIYDGTQLTLTYTDGDGLDTELPLIRPQADSDRGQANYTDAKTAKELRLFRGISLIAEYNQAFEVENITIPGLDVRSDNGYLKGLQTVLDTYAKGAAHDIVINVNKTSQSVINVKADDNVNYHTLVLPTLDHNVTLNIYGFGDPYSSNDVLTITGGEGSAGKLIINTTFGTPVKFEAADVNVVLGDVNTRSKTIVRKSVEIAEAGLHSLEFGNVDFNMYANQTLDLGSTPLFITGEVKNASGATGVLAVNEIATEGDVEITGTINTIDVKGANVTLTGGKAKNITTEGAFTAVNGDAIKVDAGTADISEGSTLRGAVTVTDNAIVKESTVNGKLTVGGNLTLTNTTVQKWSATESTNVPGDIVMNGKATKTATISNEEGIVDMAIGTLEFVNKGRVTLNNGVIKNIILDVNDKGENGTTVSSTNFSVIEDIQGPVGPVTSTWSKSAHSSASVQPVKTQGENKIYTVSQLLATMDASYIRNIVIKANTIDMKNSEWAGLSNVTSTEFNLEGLETVTTIKNVKLTGNGFINNINTTGNLTYTAASIKNLKFENVEFKEVKDNSGLLVGDVKTPGRISVGGGVTIENVEVSGKVVGTSASYNLGGMIGTVSGGDLKIVASKVNAEIVGYYNLGGVVGSVANGAAVTLGNENGVAAEGVDAKGTTILVDRDMMEIGNVNAGKVGLAVGELTGTLNLPYFIADWNVDVNAAWKYDKCRYHYKDPANDDYYPIEFKGCKNSSTQYRYYIGYSPNATAFNLQEFEMTNGYDGTDAGYKANKDKKSKVFNVFTKVANAQ